jgi:predicted Zn-dependent protease
MVRSGYPEKGLAKLKSDLLATPAAPELYEGLILSYVLLDRIPEAADAAQQRLTAVPDTYPADYLRAAALCQEIRQPTRALTILQQGLHAHPQDQDLQQALHDARAVPTP